MCTYTAWNNYNSLSHTVILRFLELQATYVISIAVDTCTISIQPRDFCKKRHYMPHQTATELFAPTSFHDLSRTSANPTTFLHGSPQPLVAHVAVVLCTKLIIYDGNSISKLQIQVATYVFELSVGNCNR